MINDYHIRLYCEDGSHYYRTIQTDKIDESAKDPAHSSSVTRDFCIERVLLNVPSCVGNSPSNLKIRTNVGSEIVDDDYTVTAHASLKKYVKISILRDDTSTDIEIYAFEKTTGEYGSVPSGKTLEKDLKEFSVVALGTVLVEENDWI